ncbi:MAG: CBS domain-containing protein [Candidatus Micrarchaeia archaeon]|jgi:predicted transcriptional regulator
MRVKDIMDTKFASLQADDRLDHILDVFADSNVVAAPVFSKGDLIGIVTYADLAKYFMPKDMLSFMDASPEGQKMTAASVAKKPVHLLTPDEPVSLALGKIIESYGCAPVMAGKKVIGVIRPKNVIEFFLAERAKTEIAGKKAGSVKKEQDYEEDSTSIDRMLEIVSREGQTTPKKLAKELGITESSAEDLAKLLGKHKLVDISYSLMKGMVIRRLEHGRR